MSDPKSIASKVQDIIEQLDIPEGSYLEISSLMQKIYNLQNYQSNTNIIQNRTLRLNEHIVFKHKNHFYSTNEEFQGSNILFTTKNQVISVFSPAIVLKYIAIGKLPYNIDDNIPSTYENDIIELSDDDKNLLLNFYIRYEYIGNNL